MADKEAYYNLFPDQRTEREREMSEANERLALMRRASAVAPYVAPYEPPLEIRYLEPGDSELKPYANNAEAWKDLGSGLAKLGVVAVGGTAIVGGAVWVWNALTVTAPVVAAPVVAATGVSWSAIGWGIFFIIAIFSFLSGRGSSEPQRSAPGAINQATAQNITVVVNVAGNNVTTSNGK